MLFWGGSKAKIDNLGLIESLLKYTELHSDLNDCRKEITYLNFFALQKKKKEQESKAFTLST